MRNDRAELPLRIEPEELRRLLPDEPAIERLATGFRFTEGPAWFPEGDYLVFSDIPGNTLYRWDEQGGIAIFRQPSLNTNGNTPDQRGRLISCQEGRRRVARTETDGSLTVIASHYEGRRLNSPNDVVEKSDGMIYFTDPNYGLQWSTGEDARKELPWQGVYRAAPDGQMIGVPPAPRPKAANVAWGGPDRGTLYITALYRVRTRVTGAPV